MFSRTTAPLFLKSNFQPQNRGVRIGIYEIFPNMFNNHGYRLALHHLVHFPTSPVPPLEINLSPDVNETNAATKVIYRKLNEEINSLREETPTHWHKNSVIPLHTKIPWKEIYRHSYIKTGRRHPGPTSTQLSTQPNSFTLRRSKYIPSCGWCGEKGTTIHLFIKCSAIQLALNFLHTLLNRIFTDNELKLRHILDSHSTRQGSPKGECLSSQLSNHQPQSYNLLALFQ